MNAPSALHSTPISHTQPFGTVIPSDGRKILLAARDVSLYVTLLIVMSMAALPLFFTQM